MAADKELAGSDRMGQCGNAVACVLMSGELHDSTVYFHNWHNDFHLKSCNCISMSQ